MFPDAGKEPYERTCRLIQKTAPALNAMPCRISITGHTAASKGPLEPGYGAWELSADRANAVRKVFAAGGLPSGHIFMVAGKADTDPLFPDNSYLSPNRRVTITLMKEAPAFAANFTPYSLQKPCYGPYAGPVDRVERRYCLGHCSDIRPAFQAPLAGITNLND